MKPGQFYNHEIHELHEKQMAFVCFVYFVVLFLATTGRAQQIPSGHATEFTSSTYYEPPHEQQIRLRLSGAEASPLPGGLLEVQTLRVETFTETGKAEAVMSAPHCLYAPLDGVASSPGRLELRTGDGKFRVEGEGFLWRQADSLLIISNRVRTVIDMPVLQPPA